VKSGGFRKVPNRLFFEQVQKRRQRGMPLTVLEAWCSLDYDLYKHKELASDRAYAALWGRSRDWVRKLMHRFRKEHGLPTPPVGRRPRPRPKPNGELPTAPDYQRAISETDS
jgi:hypothetical protein